MKRTYFLFFSSISTNILYDWERQMCEKQIETGTLSGPVLLAALQPGFGSEGLKLVAEKWRSSGYQVQLAEGPVNKEYISSTIVELRPMVVALSCNSKGSLEELKRLFAENGIPGHIPVVLGGIYATPFLAMEISQRYHDLTYYARGLEDTEAVLRKALNRESPKPPVKGQGTLFFPRGNLERIAQANDLVFFSAPISLIRLTGQPRRGCRDCPGSKDLTCPLAQGYSRERGLNKSRLFLQGFSEALLVGAPVIPENHLPEQRPQCIRLWSCLLEIEEELKKDWSRVFSFKFPVKCPLCLPEDCLMPQGICRHPDLLRPLHEEFNMDMGATIRNIAGDRKRIEMYSLILLRK